DQDARAKQKRGHGSLANGERTLLKPRVRVTRFPRLRSPFPGFHGRFALDGGPADGCSAERREKGLDGDDVGELAVEESLPEHPQEQRAILARLEDKGEGGGEEVYGHEERVVEEHVEQIVGR